MDDRKVFIVYRLHNFDPVIACFDSKMAAEQYIDDRANPSNFGIHSYPILTLITGTTIPVYDPPDPED